ncbi:hypothetical protein BGZ65_001118 [Modicella reniformis]|uniref:Uncharacterized protein n=1 Tax=Modicella reniformis TaxID=1440133 RepID=A0A9P6IPS9_9FUNG|nr:hypothetical protein BGZ65_001118 [Modicella reniformis]
MEEDFPFSFGNVSDEDQDSEGLFCAPKKKSSATRTETRIEQEPYYAQIDEDGWFHRSGKSVEEMMLQDKNGATKVKLRADHYYMLHQYQEAYEIAQEYCHIVSFNDPKTTSGDGGIRRPETGTGSGSEVLKVTDSREMQEMALRCAMKLNLFSEAAKLADELTLQDSGSVFLKARAYMATGRYSDAAIGLVQYQKTRSSNYAIWRTLAECLYESAIPAEQQPRPSITAILALISILRTRHLMRASNWTLVDYAQARYHREMKAIKNQRITYEQACGLETTEEADRMCEDDRELQVRYNLDVVKPAQECLRKMKEEGQQQLESIDGSFALEVVEFVVSSWNPQVITMSSSSAAVAMDEEEEEKGGIESVRSK